MTRPLRLAAAALAILVLLVGATTVAAAGGDGAAFGACGGHHATIEGGFSADHNPGMHPGFADWQGCSVD